MSSERRILASRANGAKSRGPITPEGKRASSPTRLRHGIIAKTIVLEGESAARFTSLLESFRTEFQPETQTEMALVENMAVARWRQMRLWGMEKAGLSHEMQKQESEAVADTPTRAALAFRVLSDQSRSLELMNRHETRYDRQFHRALQRFSLLRAKKTNFAYRTQQIIENIAQNPKLEPKINLKHPARGLALSELAC